MPIIFDELIAFYPESWFPLFLPRQALMTLGGCAFSRDIRVAALSCSGAFQTTPLFSGAVNKTVEQGRPVGSTNTPKLTDKKKVFRNLRAT